MGAQLSSEDHTFLDLLLESSKPLPEPKHKILLDGLAKAGRAASSTDGTPPRGVGLAGMRGARGEEGLSIPLAVQCDGPVPLRVIEAVRLSLEDTAACDSITRSATRERLQDIFHFTSGLLDQCTCNASVGAAPAASALAVSRVAAKVLIEEASQPLTTQPLRTSIEKAFWLAPSNISARTSSPSHSQVSVSEEKAPQHYTSPAVPRLVHAASEFLIRCPITAQSAHTHIEVLKLLITLCSTSLHSKAADATATEDSADIFIELLLQSATAGSIVLELVRRAANYKAIIGPIDSINPSKKDAGVTIVGLQPLPSAVTKRAHQTEAPTTSAPPKAQTPALLPAQPQANGWLGWLGGAQSTSTPANSAALRIGVCRPFHASAALYNLSLQLLCILLFHRRGVSKGIANSTSASEANSPHSFSDDNSYHHTTHSSGNTAREIVRSLVNSKTPTLLGNLSTSINDSQAVPPNPLAISFSQLTASLSRSASEHPLALAVLYSLILDNPLYLNVLLTKHSDTAESMVIAVLQALVYHSELVSDRLEGSNTTVHTSGGNGGGWFGWLGGGGGGGSPAVNNNSTAGAGVAAAIDGTPITAFNSATGLSVCYTFHMAATILMILSQDMCVGNALFGSWKSAGAKIHSSAVPTQAAAWQWLTGTVSSCGTLWLCTVCKCLLRAYTLHCFDAVNLLLASLQNVAPFIHDIDTAAAQRITRILSVSIKRLGREASRLQSLSRTENADKNQTEVFQVTATSVLAPLVDIIVGLADAICGGVSVTDKHNYPLFYELLYHRPQLEIPAEGEAGEFLRTFKPYLTAENKSLEEEELAIDAEAHNSRSTNPHAAHGETVFEIVTEALRPIKLIANMVDAELASVSVNHTPEGILALIRTVVASHAVLLEKNNNANSSISMTNPEASHMSINNESYSRASSGSQPMPLINCLDLVFTYQETPQSNAFFSPLFWSIITSSGKTGEGYWHDDPCQYPLLLPCRTLYDDRLGRLQ